MNSTMQREVLDWFGHWIKFSASKDSMLSFTRGPIRDFQMNFILPKVRTDAYIDTLKANFYIQEEDASEDFLKEEINQTLFADKLARIKTLDDELNILGAQFQNKLDVLHRKENEHKKCLSLCSKQQELSESLKLRIMKTTDMIQECDRLITQDYKRSSKSVDESANDSKPKDKQIRDLFEGGNAEKKLESLHAAAHNAFQFVVMRHYLADGIFAMTTSPQVGTNSSDEFNSLVLQVIHEDSCGPKISDWVHTERMNHSRICGDQARNFKLQAQRSDSSMQQSLGEKMNSVVVAWSTSHITANHKNKSRERLLKESQDSVRSVRDKCLENANIGYLLSDFVHVVYCRELFAKITRIRQYKNKSTQPIESMFKNVSMDYLSSPVTTNNLSVYLDLGLGSKMKPWIHTISDQEHIQEILGVLQKTWKCVKRNLTDMVNYAQVPNNELLPNLLQTSECIKFTIPKQLPTIIIQQHQSSQIQIQQSRTDYTPISFKSMGNELHHSFLSASTASIRSVLQNLSQLETTSLSIASAGSVSILSEPNHESQWEDEQMDEINLLISSQCSITSNDTAVNVDNSYEYKIEELRDFVSKYKSTGDVLF